jgi:hypothetical protein
MTRNPDSTPVGRACTLNPAECAIPDRNPQPAASVSIVPKPNRAESFARLIGSGLKSLWVLALFFCLTAAHAGTPGRSIPPGWHQAAARAAKAEGLPKSKARVAEEYGRLPLSFVGNQGQADGSVKFLCRGRGYSLSLTNSAAVLTLRTPLSRAGIQTQAKSQKPAPRQAWRPGGTTVVRMELAGASSDARVSGGDLLPGKVNYVIGNDPSGWRTNLPTYGQVRYTSVYPGIDLMYYGNEGQLEYDFVVAPGANPDLIRLHFSGAEDLRLTGTGDLSAGDRNGEITFHKPVVYQQLNGRRNVVPGRFALVAHRVAGFQLGDYDRSQPLIIDPTLVYSTYLGGTVEDLGAGIAIDNEGNAYIAGSTESGDFPVTQGAFQTTDPAAESHADQVFVTKVNPTGTALVYSTFLGGTWGDYGTAIALDSAGDAYVTGYTESPNFPVTEGAYQTTNIGWKYGVTNAFVTELDPTGSTLVYSTYLGGTGALSVFGDEANAIAVDGDGDAYVAGEAYSTNFPTTEGALQTANNAAANHVPNAFLTKLNATGSALVYSTYLGGSGNDFYGDAALALAVDGSGDAYLAGSTSSTDFPYTTGAFQTKNKGAANSNYNAFVAKVNATGTALVYSTYLGGSGIAGYGDKAYAIAIDGSGDAYVAGETYSSNFPWTAGACQTTNRGAGFASSNAFVTKLNSGGTGLIYSTFIGGSGSYEGTGDIAYALAVDGKGDAYLAGKTYSLNFPVTTNAYQKSRMETNDAEPFVVQLNATGSSLLYSTYFGGSGTDYAYGLATDGLGNVYITGQTYSDNFPNSTGAVQATNLAHDNHGTNVFVAKLSIGLPATAVATTTTLSSSANPETAGRAVTFTAAVTAKPGNTAPTGSVAFSVDGKAATAVTLNLAGEAKLSTSALAAGTHTIKASYTGNASFSSSSAELTETVNRPPVASPPEFSPAAGTFDIPKEITLTDATKGAVIYYTTGGEEPTVDSTRYTTAIKVSKTTTIKAIAVAPGYSKGMVDSATYTIPPPTPAPKFSPAGGIYKAAQTVKIADKDGAGLAIYYTTNGKQPTLASRRYTAAGIRVTATETTIRAIAIAAGHSESPTATATYRIK